MTFGKWPEDIHSTAEQQKRIASAKSSKTTPTKIDKISKEGIFPGSGATPYKTTLENCTCFDFSRRKLPCKHIYRLAIELGLLHETAKRGINKNVLNSSQMTLPEAVAEVEKLSDDSQNFIKMLPQAEPVIFTVSENNQELLSCTLLKKDSLEPRQILDRMQKKEILDMLKNNGHVPEKSLTKDALIPWALESVADIKSMLPDIVSLSASPYAQKIWRKLYTYLRRKYDWEHSYLESEERGMELFLVPTGVEGSCSVNANQQRAYYFPDDEITELLTFYGHNRCLNGFIVNRRDAIPAEGGGKLNRKNLVITGTFDNMTRAEVSAIIQRHGGRVNEWITKNTAYVVVGDKAGNKLQQAKEKGVPLLSLKELFSLIDEN